MSNIFIDKNIYPHEGKIKDHYKDFYDSVFVAFLPFFQVDIQRMDKANLMKPKQITYEEAKQEIEIFKDIPPFSADIYIYSTKDYPTDQEIIENGRMITWKSIIENAEFTNYSELNKALRTSIGALKPVFSRPDLSEKLNNLTDKQNLWHPREGVFGTFSKLAIYKTFKLFGKYQIIVTDESYNATSTLELDKLTDLEFSEKVSYENYCLYSTDKELLFAIEWDSFFFLIASDKEKMNKIIEQRLFEGFLCNDKTEHDWDYEEGEIQKYLDIEKKQKLLKPQSTAKKQWWKFWN